MFKLHRGAEFRRHYLAEVQPHMVHRGAVKSQRKLNTTGGLPVMLIQLIFFSLIEISSWVDVPGASMCLLVLAENMKKCLSLRTAAEDHDFLPHILSSQESLSLYSVRFVVTVR